MEMMQQARLLEEHLAQVEARLTVMEGMEADPMRDLPFDFRERIGHVRMLLEIARDKLGLAEMAGSDAWEGFHNGVEFACHEAEKAASKLKAR
jgi:hypothetical protein